LNWHGTWNAEPNNLKINAIFFENYWNEGSPVEQERYFDNIVISTKRINCACGESDVEENGIEELLNIYPNPADDFISVTMKPSEGFEPSEGSAISIYNTLGEMLLSVGTGRDLSVRINIGDLPKGMYFIKMGDRTTKFVKV